MCNVDLKQKQSFPLDILNDVSTSIPCKANAHMRQWVRFEGGAESGAKKNNYAVRDAYRGLVTEVLGGIKN